MEHLRDGWLHLATSGPVVRRALKYALVVGAVLITINHGDAILHGNLDTTRFLKMGLTVIVPYAVSTLSSVEAMRGKR
jgi:hypothetical protein